MVEFCGSCGTSLPKGDLTIKGGKLFTSADYVCPSCKKPANPAVDSQAKQEGPEPTADRDIRIKQGKATLE